MVDAMLEASDPIELGGAAADAIDIVGTGGGASRRARALNVSTMACFVAAGAGAPVCKHGNRKASSTSGSFDLLEALGVAIDLDGPGVRRLRRAGRPGLLLRPGLPPGDAPRRPGAGRAGHPDAVQLHRAAVEPRPGVTSGDRGQRPGHGAHGRRGPPAPRIVTGDGRARPRRHGRAHHHRDARPSGSCARATCCSTSSTRPASGCRSSTSTSSAVAMPRPTPPSPPACSHGEAGPERDIVVLNAAAGLVVGGRADDLAAGIGMATASIDDGHTAAALDRLRQVSPGRGQTCQLSDFCGVAALTGSGLVRGGGAAGAALVEAERRGRGRRSHRDRRARVGQQLVDVDEAAGPFDLDQLGLRHVEEVELRRDALEHLGRGVGRGLPSGRGGAFGPGHGREADGQALDLGHLALERRQQAPTVRPGVVHGDDEVLVELDGLVLEIAPQLVDRQAG